MTVRARRWLYVFAISIFGLMSPLLLLYANGYRFDWRRIRLLRTGGVVVTSVPTDARVFLDGQSFARTTPMNITAEFPGTYRLTLERPAFQSWSSTVNIQASQTRKIDATLLPSTPRRTEFTFDRVLTAASGSSGRLAVLSQSNGQAWLGVAHPSAVEYRPLARLVLPPAAAPVLAWSARGSFIAVLLPNAALRIIDATDGHDVTPRSAQQPFDRITWDPGNDRLLYAVGGGSLWRVDLISSSAQVVASPGVRDVAIANGETWVLRAGDHQLSVQRLDPLAINTIQYQTRLHAALDITRIYAIHRHVVVTAGPTGVAVLDRRTGETDVLPITDLQEAVIDTTDSFVLLRTPTELWSVDIGHSTESLVVSQSSLRAARWYPKRPVALVLTDDGLRLEDIFLRSGVAGTLGPFPDARQLHLIDDRTVIVETDHTLVAFQLH
ncbi:MAG: PEGA domain-containing protein [Candidatus Kerfeldbacteria bacterium]|nr:PEGA domain-containing protein [Candidatus Kerfeldbacteria bacterium]